MTTTMTATGRGPIARLLGRLGRSNADLDHDLLRKQALQSGAQTIGEAPMRVPVTLQGRISMVTLTPSKQNHWLEAELQDGTGSVRLIWIGRRTIPGIEAGRTLRLHGRIGIVEGIPTIYNPSYDLIS